MARAGTTARAATSRSTASARNVTRGALSATRLALSAKSATTGATSWETSASTSAPRRTTASTRLKRANCARPPAKPAKVASQPAQPAIRPRHLASTSRTSALKPALRTFLWKMRVYASRAILTARRVTMTTQPIFVLRATRISTLTFTPIHAWTYARQVSL